SVDIDQEHRIANVTVPERMLSLAIGREGQNARLAARLTGWRIDIRSDVSVAEAKAAADEARAQTKVDAEAASPAAASDGSDGAAASAAAKPARTSPKTPAKASARPRKAAGAEPKPAAEPKADRKSTRLNS